MCWLEQKEARVPSSQFGSLYLVSCRGRETVHGTGAGIESESESESEYES